MSEFTLLPVALYCLLPTEAAKDRCLKQVFLCTSVVVPYCRGIRHVRATLAAGPFAPLRRLQWSTRTIMAVQQVSDSIDRSIVKGPRGILPGRTSPVVPAFWVRSASGCHCRLRIRTVSCAAEGTACGDTAACFVQDDNFSHPFLACVPCPVRPTRVPTLVATAECQAVSTRRRAPWSVVRLHKLTCCRRVV